MSTTFSQQRDFVSEVFTGSSILDDTIEWISSQMEPSDVFSEDDLADWATSNGYVLDTDPEY